MDAKHNETGKTCVILQTEIREYGWVKTNAVIPDLSLFFTLNATGGREEKQNYGPKD